MAMTAGDTDFIFLLMCFKFFRQPPNHIRRACLLGGSTTYANEEQEQFRHRSSFWEIQPQGAADRKSADVHGEVNDRRRSSFPCSPHGLGRILIRPSMRCASVCFMGASWAWHESRVRDPHAKTGDPSRERRSAMNRTTGKTSGGDLGCLSVSDDGEVA